MILQLIKVHFASANKEALNLERKEARECFLEKCATPLIKMNKWIQIVSI